jgi:hypothetical protein
MVMNGMEKEQKMDDSSMPSSAQFQLPPKTSSSSSSKHKPLNLIQAMLGNCLCDFAAHSGHKAGDSTQFVELHSVKFIGLGAVVDELTPRERVYDTLEQLTTRTERLVSIGYLMDQAPPVYGSYPLEGDGDSSSVAEPMKATDTIPLDVWNQNYPDDASMSKPVQTTITKIKVRCVRRNAGEVRDATHAGVAHRFALSISFPLQIKEYSYLAQELAKNLAAQTARPDRGNNRYLVGITAHNLGVIKVLLGRDDEATPLFQQAIALKKVSFGTDHPEVALSWDELGIQLFAFGDFDTALEAFHEAHIIRSKQEGSTVAPTVAMVLNNIACCYFQVGKHETALQKLEEASEIQHKAVGSSAQADLDLLHVAIVVCNCGYLKLALKQYEEARSLFEEALLIQQSVLDDNHRAVRDTLSNIDFTNAFHS